MNALNRPPQSAAEVAAIEVLDPTQRLAFVRANGPSLAAETLVHMMRVGYAERDTMLVREGVRYLLGFDDGAGRLRGGHCEGIIGAIARRSFSPDARDHQSEFRQRCLVEALTAIQAGADSKPYWESRFYDAFRKRCLDVRRKLLTEERREMLGSELQEAEEEGWEQSVVDSSTDTSVAQALQLLLRVERDEALWRIINSLPDRQRQAFLLRFHTDLPVTGRGLRTVCRVMGISEANAHKLINKACARLREHPDIRFLWRDRS